MLALLHLQKPFPSQDPRLQKQEYQQRFETLAIPVPLHLHQDFALPM
jgi:hypothetical protein